MKRLFTLMLGAMVAAGCVDRSPTEVPSYGTALSGLDAAAKSGPGITVMTYNVYYGTDPEPLLAVTNPDDIPFVAAGIWALAQQTNFPERAGALAAEIAKQRPHLVGVQEAALYRTQSPSDFFLPPDQQQAAQQVVYDFLELLVDSLAAHGELYVVAASDATTDIEVPVFTGVGAIPFDDVRLTDRDAVLVRGDVAWSNPQGDKFSAHIPLFGTGVYEGWASVEATIQGQNYRFVSAHLEFQQAAPIQVLQAQELIDLLQDETLPTILVGDFNSDASGLNSAKETASYGMLTDAGFVDSWNRSGYSTAGLTCCQDKDLLNPFGTYDERVDIIFTRNMPLQTRAGTLVLSRKLVGDRPGDRTASGLWPSDHAGVVATFLVPPVAPAAVAAN